MSDSGSDESGDGAGTDESARTGVDHATDSAVESGGEARPAGGTGPDHADETAEPDRTGDPDGADAPDETNEPAEADDPDEPAEANDPDGTTDAEGSAASDETDLDALRAEVERRYDFENFGPSDMAEMDAAEWEAAFDPETWITGEALLDRVEADLRTRIARREVFAVLERDPNRVVAYADEGWAVVYPDGSVEGSGTVLRDVKPTVALCSMESYEPEEPPEAYELPDPEEVEAGTGELGNTMLQVIAGAQLLAGVGLLGVWLFTGAIPATGGLANIVVPALAVFFVGIGLLLFLIVANARLSDRFRAEEYRDRLRAAGIDDADRPDFLPPPEVSATREALDSAADDTDVGSADSQVGGDGRVGDDSQADGGDSDSDRSA